MDGKKWKDGEEAVEISINNRHQITDLINEEKKRKVNGRESQQSKPRKKRNMGKTNKQTSEQTYKPQNPQDKNKTHQTSDTIPKHPQDFEKNKTGKNTLQMGDVPMEGWPLYITRKHGGETVGVASKLFHACLHTHC